MHFQPHVQLAALAVAATSVGALPLVGGGAEESAHVGNIQESGGASYTLPKRIVLPPGSAPIETPVTFPNGIRPEILAANGKRSATATATGEDIKGTIGPFAGDLHIGPDGKITGSFDSPLGDTSGSVQVKREAATPTFTGETIKGTIGPFTGDLTIGPDGKLTGSFNSPLGGTEGSTQLPRAAENGGADVNAHESIHLPPILPRSAYINPKYGLGPEIPPSTIQFAQRGQPDAAISVDTPVADLTGDVPLKRGEPGAAIAVDTPVLDLNGDVPLKRSEPGATVTVDTPVLDLNGDIPLKRGEPLADITADTPVADLTAKLGLPSKRDDIEASGSVNTPYANGNGAANARLPIIFDA